MAGVSSSSGTQSMSNELFPKKTSLLGSKQTGRLRYPGIGIGPDGRSVLADDEIERGVGKGDVLARGLHQGERQPELRLELAGDGELAVRRVDADRRGPEPGQPRRNIGSAASEFERGLALEIVGEQVDRSFRHPEDSPGGLSRRPPSTGRLQLIFVTLIPRGHVALT